ncbi:hypothetical protein XELAEV_18004461mg, partial [Xenopus laevis]
MGFICGFRTKWQNFKSLQEPARKDIDSLLLFVLEQVEAQQSLASIKKHLAGISFFFRMLGAMDLTKAPIIKQIGKSLAKSHRSKDGRKPITLFILHKLLLALEGICSSPYETKLFKCLFLLMYFAALRVGEATAETKFRMGGLNYDDVTLVGNKLKINIKKSKTDVAGKGTTIWIGEFNYLNLCPVSALSEFLMLRPNIQGPLFIHLDGTNLSRFQLSQ